MSNIVRLGIVLAIVTLIAAFVLAEIYSVTKPRIEIQKKAKEREALDYVLPNAKVLEPVSKKIPIVNDEGDTLYQKEVVEYYRAYEKEDSTGLIGYAFKAEGAGYSSIIETMVGFDTWGDITRIKIISQKETPGLGALAENSEPFEGKKWSTQQFRDKSVEDLKVDKDGGEIVSITGATITSRAITNSIRTEMKDLLNRIEFSPKDQTKEN
ncbi:MAG: RnfABCDGE type electron transport complex subunit G [Calditrichaeota bacterium]|nr:RnfABCDGE type electron transport complex subunit G [Calditrichota bacterium]RQV99273.1 MAG: RnfABCDGE type electron transport complex subunit G [Calditrichota bacterium]